MEDALHRVMNSPIPPTFVTPNTVPTTTEGSPNPAERKVAKRQAVGDSPPPVAALPFHAMDASIDVQKAQDLLSTIQSAMVELASTQQAIIAKQAELDKMRRDAGRPSADQSNPTMQPVTTETSSAVSSDAAAPAADSLVDSDMPIAPDSTTGPQEAHQN